MKELLEQWAGWEPGWCEFELPIGRFQVYYNLNNGHYGNIYNLDNPTLAHIQYSIQQAITARGWFIDLKFYYQWGARIFNHDGLDVLGAWRDTAPESLLSAYIKALEAVGEVER